MKALKQLVQTLSAIEPAELSLLELDAFEEKMVELEKQITAARKVLEAQLNRQHNKE